MKLVLMTLFGIMTFLPAVSANEMCKKLDDSARGNARNVSCVSISDDAERSKCEAKHSSDRSVPKAQSAK